MVEEKNDGYVLNDKAYKAFKKAINELPIDCLILLGDIFEFSIEKYHKAYEAAKIFFDKITEDGITEKLIYVPGNHDFEIWHIVEHEVNIINKMPGKKPNKTPTKFRWTVPCVITEKGHIVLPDVNESNGYGDLFLKNLISTCLPLSNGKKPVWLIAYPNVYFVPNEGDSILLTHGHFFEAYWAMGGKWGPRILYPEDSVFIKDTDNNKGNRVSLKDVVSMNFPLHQLASSGIGQAGKLTKVIRKIQNEAEYKKGTKVYDEYTKRLIRQLPKKKQSWWNPVPFVKNCLWGSMYKMANWHLRGEIEDYQDARDKDFLEKPETKELIQYFYNSSLEEIKRLNDNKGLNDNKKLHNPLNVTIKNPGRIIFGHTHDPIPWNDMEKKKEIEINGKTVYLHNTGGWLKDNEGKFCGAEVFVYDGKQFCSKPIVLEKTARQL
jgi:predicted phosphodiesterase